MSIVLLVGASASGKTTVGKELERRFRFEQLVSFTTREKRKGEVDGVDYNYLTFDELEELELAEYSEYNGNLYGLTKKEVNTKLAQHEDVYFITNADGARQLQRMYPHETVCFWFKITVEEMVNRMRERGDSSEQIISRFEHAVDTKELVKPEGLSSVYEIDARKPIKQVVNDIAENMLSHELNRIYVKG